jgi:hypothetical protein
MGSEAAHGVGGDGFASVDAKRRRLLQKRRPPIRVWLPTYACRLHANLGGGDEEDC